LEYLVEAMILLSQSSGDYRLIIAGRPKGAESYWERIRHRIESSALRSSVVARVKYVPDAETELYFKAADVLALPYRHIFQSGVLLLSYAFGLPVIASDVGSLKADIVDGQTGFLCAPGDPGGLAGAIERYFSSDLYAKLEARREDIRGFARRRYSWTTVGTVHTAVYTNLYSGIRSRSAQASERERAVLEKSPKTSR
jgi:glycosyltransferase involved in cell wall biosynthesis